MNALNVKYMHPATIKPSPRNSRIHSAKQVKQIARSIEKFGFNNPILLDECSTVIAGHGRLEAAKLLGIETVPTICLKHMSVEQRRAYIIADNRIAELAGWDDDILKIELQELISSDLDFDVIDIGFEMAEIDLILGDAETSSVEPKEPPLFSSC